MPELLGLIEKITDMGKSIKDNQAEINVLEITHLWKSLQARYHIAEETMILRNFVKDTDLKMAMDVGLKTINKQMDELEKWMANYGVPLPKRPPQSVNTPVNPEVITDEYIYHRVFFGIQGFLHGLMQAFIEVSSPKLREPFKDYILNEISIYDKLWEYGKLKGWSYEPPAYRV